MNGRAANGRVLGKETKGRAGYSRPWLIMADCESSRNKDHMPHYYVRLAEMQRQTYHAQTNNCVSLTLNILQDRSINCLLWNLRQAYINILGLHNLRYTLDFKFEFSPCCKCSTVSFTQTPGNYPKETVLRYTDYGRVGNNSQVFIRKKLYWYYF
jgi:hypothetical protein